MPTAPISPTAGPPPQDPFTQGLSGDSQPKTATPLSPDAQKLSDTLANMQGKALDEAIQHVQSALDKPLLQTSKG